MKINLGKYVNELAVLVVGIAFYIYAPSLIRLIEPQAGQYDASYLHRFAYAFVGLAMALTSARLFLHILFPQVEKFIEDFFKEAFQLLTKWQQIKVSLGLLLSFLFCFTLLVLAM